MIIRRRFAGELTLALIVLSLGGCDAVFSPDAVVRYRLTVTVETPDDVKSGSSVIELQASRNADWERKVTGRTGGYSIRGEAVAVDLPDGRTLFALLRGESDSVSAFDWPWMASGINRAVFDDPQSLLEKMSGNRSESLLPRRYETGCVTSQNCNDSAYPLFVIFKDIKDPTSVERVHPDDLAARLGRGYRLKAITTQVTDAPVTVGIQKRLRWLDSHIGSLVKRKRNQPIGDLPLEQRANVGDFVRKR